MPNVQEYLRALGDEAPGEAAAAVSAGDAPDAGPSNDATVGFCSSGATPEQRRPACLILLLIHDGLDSGVLQGEEGAAKVKKSKKSKEKKRDRSAEKDAEAATEPAAVSGGGSEKVREWCRARAWIFA